MPDSAIKIVTICSLLTFIIISSRFYSGLLPADRSTFTNRYELVQNSPFIGRGVRVLIFDWF
jgi:hypothetical protein